MKTIHRIMYESLTPENYKKFCKNIKPEHIWWFCNYYNPSKLTPCFILSNSFAWSNSSEKELYWHGVWVDLHNKERGLV